MPQPALMPTGNRPGPVTAPRRVRPPNTRAVAALPPVPEIEKRAKLGGYRDSRGQRSSRSAIDVRERPRTERFRPHGKPKATGLTQAGIVSGGAASTNVSADDELNYR
jgi:hypothetical protein